MIKALADRLAEALAELLHQRVRVFPLWQQSLVVLVLLVVPSLVAIQHDIGGQIAALDHPGLKFEPDISHLFERNRFAGLF